MSKIIPNVRFAVKQRLTRHMRKCRDPALRVRCLIVLNLLAGRSVAETATALKVAPSTINRVAHRFSESGEVGLLDRREDNGQAKLDEFYLAILYTAVESSPHEYGRRRPTWTRQMLVETLHKITGIRIHVGTMSRALKIIRARRARPRPVVRCPWSKAAKNRRIAAIRRMLKNLPPGHVAVYADEVDIDLNPKIGLDWMVRGQQKEAVTPGQNVKRYIAGAMNAKTGQLVWVQGHRKNSLLFIALLRKLAAKYPQAEVIHVVLDNYRVHKSKITRLAVKEFGGRIRLHFLPPYCPSENRIERLWEDLHAEVTRNHCCEDIDSLMHEAGMFLRRRGVKAHRLYLKQAA